MGKLKMKYKKVFCRVLPLLAALVLVLGSCLTVCAEESIDYDTEYAKLCDSYSELKNTYCFVLGQSINSIWYFSDKPFTSNENGSTLSYSDNCNIYTYTRDNASGSFVRNSGHYYDNSGAILVNGDKKLNCVYTSHKIYDNLGNLVFRGPVPPLVKAAEGIVPEEVMKETIGLLPLLIPFLVGLVGFWKGLRFLLQILRKA